MTAQEWRITDGDRLSAAQALGEHYAAGRLDKAEFDERSERAYAAKTNQDLRPLFVDLPAPHGPTTAPAPAIAPPVAAPTFRRPGPRGFPFPLVPLVILAVFVGFHLLWILPFVLIGLLLLRGHRRWHGPHWQGRQWQGRGW